MDERRMVRCRAGQRFLNQPARHGARSSGSRGGPESERRAGLASCRADHAAPNFDEERNFDRAPNLMPQAYASSHSGTTRGGGTPHRVNPMSARRTTAARDLAAEHALPSAVTTSSCDRSLRRSSRRGLRATRRGTWARPRN